MAIFWGFIRWLGSIVARALDSQSIGRGFNSWLVHCQVTTLGKLSCASVTKQYNLVPAKGR